MEKISFPFLPFVIAAFTYVALSCSCFNNEDRTPLTIVIIVITEFMYLAAYGLCTMLGI